MAKNELDAKYLEGLTFSGSKPVKVKKDGADKIDNQKFERSLTADDVLDWKDAGDSVVIISKDGKKYNVIKKKPKAEK
jgi:hypothetical protein